MHYLLLTISAFAALSLLISILNFFTIRRVRNAPSQITSRVSVLIPMRNEEFNAHALLETLLRSTGLEHVEYSVLDDGSTDKTPAILSAFSDRVKILTGGPLPDGWLGKPHACHLLSQAATGEYLVFLDADLRVKPDAIASSISLMDCLGWDFLSPYPAEHGKSFLMHLVQPLLQWSWLSSVPLRLAESDRRNSMVIANGQFFIVKRAAYDAVSGHTSVKNEILEDLSLARRLTSAGFKGGVAEASAVAECTMYESDADLIAGYTKSLWKAFGGPVGTMATLLLLTLTQVLPFLLILAGVWAALIPFFLVASTHLLAAIRVRTHPGNALLHPFAGLALMALIMESYRRKSRGQLQWRGRRVL